MDERQRQGGDIVHDPTELSQRFLVDRVGLLADEVATLRQSLKTVKATVEALWQECADLWRAVGESQDKP